jgi:pimeloyl-ACP methyl ester carboxylesterase
LNNLNLQKSGSGKTKLVAIHGLGSASTAWNLVKPALSQSYEFITLDLPGHGAAKMRATKEMSPFYLSQLIKNELADNGIETFHLMGNSLGGWIALELAAQFPSNVLSVTGVAPAGLWFTPKTHRNGELAISRYMARSTYKLAYPIARLRFMRQIGFKLVSPRWEKFSIETCAEAAIAMGSATIIFGDSDYTLPESNSQERTLAPSHAKWIRLSQSGHAPMWDQVEAVVEETIKTIETFEAN